jgi:hypothetical protein
MGSHADIIRFPDEYIDPATNYRIRIRFTRIRIQPKLYADPDPDLGCQSNADPDPGLSITKFW